MAKKRFAVIGMGRFGFSVASSLCKMGVEVLAIDEDESRTQAVSHFVTQAVSADSTDEEALGVLGVQDYDVVIVAIGQDIQASILTTLILKDLGAPVIVAKAQNELHGKVLAKIGADKVIHPERDMGLRVAHHLMSPNIIDYVEISDEYSILELQATVSMIGKSLVELDLRAKYRCNVIAVKKDGTGTMDLSPDARAKLAADDILVLVGHQDDLVKMELAMTQGRSLRWNRY
jgi:trk system potassium uptake protein